MSSNASDHLANERTFLAWIRTSISVIVFGFVVAKFGITLRQFLNMQGKNNSPSGLSLSMGVVFMVTGIVLAVVSLYRYYKTRQRLESAAFKPAGAAILFLGILTAISGAVLAAYLLFAERKM